MRYRVALLAALVSSVGLALLAPVADAAGAKRAQCSYAFDLPSTRCFTLSVPLDRAGKVPGKVGLFYEVVPARKKKSKAAIVLFPGGPGGATSILGYDVLPLFRKQMADHDLLLYDQRGTGRSGYIDCDRELESGSSGLLVGDATRSFGKGVERCAKKLGARRSFYTTREAVEDLEAVRQAA